MHSQLYDSILKVHGIGKKYADFLYKQGIETIIDLIYFYPRKWIDRSKVFEIKDINKECECITVIGKVTKKEKSLTANRSQIVNLTISDDNGDLRLVWFNQPFLLNTFRVGTRYSFSGKVVYNNYQRMFIMESPDFEMLGEQNSIHTGRVIPIYPSGLDISEKKLRQIMWDLLKDELALLDDWLPQKIKDQGQLADLKFALQNYHFPESRENWRKARQRLAFDELFMLQLLFSLKRMQHQVNGIVHNGQTEMIDHFIELLPYSLTRAQQRVVGEIIKDMEAAIPMRRLVQGDVGSGKTIVAAISLMKTVSCGYQGALMVPTEILAEQHYKSLKSLFEPLGIKIELLVGSISVKDKEIILERAASGDVNIVVGTHALIQDGVNFARLGLIVIDEQHRFGVHQRFMLEKKGMNPDLLVMSATPIPRTLALTLYGELDVSVIDELPPGRQVIETYLVSPDKKKDAYKLITKQIEAGHQVYYVCPFVEDSDVLDVKSVETAYQDLKTIFPQYQIALLHGRLKGQEKEQIMSDFVAGKLNILVATTVIEVGVNNPNATVIVVEDAERFGLSQLHQLRGRVGRGKHKSYCLLFSKASGESIERLRVMERTIDGFVLAEEDLKLRGQGEFFGQRQHGIAELRIANIQKDITLIQIARSEVQKLLQSDPGIIGAENKLLRERIIAYAKEKSFDIALN